MKITQKIKASDVLAEWDPFTLPIVAQTDGHIVFKDLEEGVTTRQIVDDSTGLSSNIVIDWKQQAKNQHLVPRVEIHDKKNDGKVLVLKMEVWHPTNLQLILSFLLLIK